MKSGMRVLAAIGLAAMIGPPAQAQDTPFASKPTIEITGTSPAMTPESKTSQ